MDVAKANLLELWRCGYSIGELWGNGEPVSRGGPTLEAEHLILWGILSIVEDQVSHGAGHRYLRDRLWHRDWIAIGFLDQRLAVLPQIENAKFGRKPSAVGDGITNYLDVRVVHARVFEAAGRAT
jgi:hypothetical protein